MSERETLADKLRPYVAALELSSADGDAKANSVISLYQMHVACPSDPGAPALCEAAFNEWIASKGITP